MIVRRAVVTAMTALSIVGCETPTPDTDCSNPLSVAQETTVEYDDYAKVTKFTGPQCFFGYWHLLFFCMRAWKHDDGATGYQIYIRTQGDDEWDTFDRAYDAEGKPLNITFISRDDLRIQNVGVDIPEVYLRENRHSGIRFKLYGNGEQVFFIPPEYIDGFLSVTEQRFIPNIPAGETR